MGNKKVFICDDDAGISDMLAIIVESTGNSVLIENTSSKLYGRLVEEKPDLLFIDLWMPEMTGDEIIKKVRANKIFENLYIVCISASIGGKEIALHAGADQFLAKPFDIEHIFELLSRPLLRNIDISTSEEPEAC